MEKPVPLAHPVDEALRLLAAARERGVDVRLAGGLAIRMVCPSAQWPALRRDYGDIDLAVTRSSKRQRVTELMTGLGYVPDVMLNALNEGNRLRFDDVTNRRHVDVFVDAIRMCHVIEFKDRIDLAPDTLSPTDLLLTKLQIVELNHKDMLDAIALLHDHGREVDVAYLAKVWGNDWPLWKTSGVTLAKIADAVVGVLHAEPRDRVVKAVEGLDRVREAAPKTLRWKVRAHIGERMRWYELPEDAG